MQTPPPGAAFVVYLIVLVAVGTVCMVLYKIAVWWGERVNTFEDAPPVVMSLSKMDDAVNRLSSLQTDSQTDSRQPAPPVPSRDVMLNTYRLLRKYGVPREEARPILKAAGLPLDNNLWTAAAPPAPPHVTPIAGRRTDAQFEGDPDYPYEALA